MDARRTELRVTFEGVDISADVNQYLISLSYTDNETGSADDLQLTLDDYGGVWVRDWLNTPMQPPPAPVEDGWRIGDEVIVNGRPQYTSYGTGRPGYLLTNYRGHVTHLNLRSGIPYPIHVDYKGWYALDQVQKVSAKQDTMLSTGGAKGAEISAVLVQKNWDSDGQDRVLDCGRFQVDAVDAGGPPATVTIKASSIPYTSTVRTQKKTKAWENIRLSAIANEIAGGNGLSCIFESPYNPYYSRTEQMQESDITFLQRLCKSAGIALKVIDKKIVLFDVAQFEKNAPVRTFQYAESDILRYSFSTSLQDTAYSRCRVKYTDSSKKQTFEGEYSVSTGSGQVLEINEKVSSNEEARTLAQKRLREKNSKEFKGSLNLVGDARLVAGLTVMVDGFGAFNGKYIIERASHSVSRGGYSTALELRRVLEGY